MDPLLSLRRILLQFSVVFALATPLAVHAAEGNALHLHLDDGFLGHPVTLDLPDGHARVSWATGGLMKSGDLDLSLVDGVLTVSPSTPDMFAPGAIAVSMQATSTTDMYSQTTIQTQDVSGGWHALASTQAKGFVSARSAAGVFKVAVVQTWMKAGTASWYKYKHCNCAASPDFPKGTKLLVRRADDPTKSVVITVNDYGPDRRLFPNRVIDLDKVAFAAIGNPRGGVMQVTVEPYVPPTKKAATSS